jgi:serine/threonine protein kinase
MASANHPAASAADTDLSGRQLDNYQVLRRLGRGAMAEVYLAEQLSLRRQVAFKVLKSNLATDAGYVRRFHREAQAAASLVHANIVQIYEVGCLDGIHFIAQEYVQGSNLNEFLARRGSPDLKQAIGITLQIAAALHKAAERGIVHRDIKPENIMLAANGEVKVADFGLARAATDEHATALTQVGFTMGTPLYMSPEQVEGKPLDGRSDIYSLGVTCYHMLAGQPPFRGETALAVAVQHIREQPERLENVRPDLPPTLCRIVHKMLAKAPADRYPDAKELARDLRALAATELGDLELDHVTFNGEGNGHNGTARVEATRRLETLMQQSAQLQRSTASHRWRWVAALIVAFLIGLVAANRLRERRLLAPLPPGVLNVDRKSTAEAQYIYALMVDTEDAWKSVSAYFPNDRVWGLRAKQQLARLYLQDDDYERAMTIFREFADQPDVEQQFRAFGLAGEAAVLAFQQDYRHSADKLAELWPHRQSLDPQMKNLIAYVLRRNQKALATPNTDNWRKFLQPTVPGAGPRNPRPGNRNP